MTSLAKIVERIVASWDLFIVEGSVTLKPKSILVAAYLLSFRFQQWLPLEINGCIFRRRIPGESALEVQWGFATSTMKPRLVCIRKDNSKVCENNTSWSLHGSIRCIYSYAAIKVLAKAMRDTEIEQPLRCKAGSTATSASEAGWESIHHSHSEATEEYRQKSFTCCNSGFLEWAPLHQSHGSYNYIPRSKLKFVCPTNEKFTSYNFFNSTNYGVIDNVELWHKLYYRSHHGFTMTSVPRVIDDIQ